MSDLLKLELQMVMIHHVVLLVQGWLGPLFWDCGEAEEHGREVDKRGGGGCQDKIRLIVA